MNIESMRIGSYRSFKVDDAELPDACRRLGVELRVLPPRRPQWNGCVERANRPARIEFRNLLDCELTVQAAFLPRPPLPERVPCRPGGCPAPVPNVLNQYNHLPPRTAVV